LLFLLAFTFLFGLIHGSQIGVVWTLCAHSLLGKLAPLAESFDLQRTAQECELSQARCTFEKLVYFGYFYITYPSAPDAKDVLMRLHVAVIARGIVEERYLARFSRFAKLLQNPMDGGP
jgi:hypothetical protein